MQIQRRGFVVLRGMAVDPSELRHVSVGKTKEQPNCSAVSVVKRMHCEPQSCDFVQTIQNPFAKIFTTALKGNHQLPCMGKAQQSAAVHYETTVDTYFCNCETAVQVLRTQQQTKSLHFLSRANGSCLLKKLDDSPEVDIDLHHNVINTCARSASFRAAFTFG